MFLEQEIIVGTCLARFDLCLFVFNIENLGKGSALIWCIFGAHTEDKGGWTWSCKKVFKHYNNTTKTSWQNIKLNILVFLS